MSSIRAVLYARVSGDDYDDDELSKLDAQLSECREYAGKQGYTILHEFREDTYSSGADLDLPKLNQILDLARDGTFDILVCRELDRLARGIAKQLFIEEELKRSGVQIEYVLEKYDDTPEGGLMKHVKASVAEYERIKIAQRTRRGKRRSVSQGNVTCCGLPPYGYIEVITEGDKRGLAIKPAEAAVVEDIFEMYVSDADIGTAAIARRISAQGIPSPYRKPKKRSSGSTQWNGVTIRRILLRETYRGKWQYGKQGNREAIDVAVPAIINGELWAAAQAKLEVRRRARIYVNDYPFLLRDLAFCSKCGSPMRCKADRRGMYYYVCSNYKLNSRHSTCDQSKSFRADAIDVDLWEQFKLLASDPDRLRRAFQKYKASLKQRDNPVRDKLEAKRKLVTKNMYALDRLLDEYEDGELSQERYRKRKNSREVAMSKYKKEVAALEAELDQEHARLDQLQTMKDYVSEAPELLKVADENDNLKREFLSRLGLRAGMSYDSTNKYVDVAFFTPTVNAAKQHATRSVLLI